MERVDGMFEARVLQNQNVEYIFTPNHGSGNARPILASGVESVENDLVTTFGFSLEKAKAAVVELKEKGVLNMAASVDAAVLPKLVVQRSAH